MKRKKALEKGYYNTQTLEIFTGFYTRKEWKKIKERDGKPSEWKRVLMNYFRAQLKERHNNEKA